MGTIPDLRAIKTEDFDKKDQKMVDQIAFPINNFMQQVINLFRNGIDYNNLNQQVNTFTVSVNEFGFPTNTIQFRNNLRSKVQGMTCINTANQSSTIRFPIAQPCITWTQNGNLVIITNISGLGIPEGQTVSDTYQLTVLSYGANLPTV